MRGAVTRSLPQTTWPASSGQYVHGVCWVPARCGCVFFPPCPCDRNNEMTQIIIQWHGSLTCFHSLTKDTGTKLKLMMDDKNYDKTSQHLSSKNKHDVIEGRDPVRTHLLVWRESWSFVPIPGSERSPLVSHQLTHSHCLQWKHNCDYQTNNGGGIFYCWAINFTIRNNISALKP